MDFPVEALDDRLGFVGISGSGKTYAAGALVERLLGQKSRCIILDPLDVWWGLRLDGDGERASKFKPVILGGSHADLPLNERAGALVGETIASAAESFIVSTSLFETIAAERRFMLAMLTTLYRCAGGELLHLIFDEADQWAPQQIVDKEGEAAKLLGQMERVVRRGRVKGFVPWLITQRPAVLNKNVLSQMDGLAALKLTSSQDRDAIGEWVKGQADRETWLRMWGNLPAMQTGQAIIWLPARSVLHIAKFPRKVTFDSSAAPKRGETRVNAALQPLNVDALREQMESVAKEAVENDPQRLKARIAELNRALAASEKRATTLLPDAPQLAAAEDRGYARGRADLAAEMLGQFTDIRSAHQQAVHSIAEVFSHFLNRVEPLLIKQRSGPPHKLVHTREIILDPSLARILPKPTQTETADQLQLPVGERACLIAAAQHPEGVSRQQMTVLTGYKRSTRDAYIARLRAKGYLDTQDFDGRVVVTAAGAAALGSDYQPLPTGEALREYWLSNLPEGERRILDVLIKCYPEWHERRFLDELTGFQRSTRDAYLSRLKRRELIETGVGTAVRATGRLW